MKQVLVTGGAGFIGSHVVDALLERRMKVTVLDDFSTGSLKNLGEAPRAGLTVVQGDIASRAAHRLVVELRPDAILMLAAQPSVKVSMRDPTLDAHTNLLGLVNLLEAARATSCRKVVFASSGGTIYGDVSPERLPIQEHEPRRACSFYGLTKLTALSYLELYREHFGLNYAALALGNVYGPRQSPDGEAGVIAIFAKRILNGEPCVVNGDGLTTRDYVYVTDVANAFVAALERGSGLINLGTGQEASVLEIHAQLSRSAGSSRAPNLGPALPGEVRRVSLDPRRAAAELGWAPTMALGAGIDRVLSWMREQHLRTEVA